MSHVSPLLLLFLGVCGIGGYVTAKLFGTASVRMNVLSLGAGEWEKLLGPFQLVCRERQEGQKSRDSGGQGQGERSQGSPFTFSDPPPQTRGALIQHNTNSAGLHLRSPKRVNTEHRSSACARREGRDTVNQLHRSAQ